MAVPADPCFDPVAFEAFLALLPDKQDGMKLRHVVEARHPSFTDPAAVALLRRFGVARALVDSEKQALLGDQTGGFRLCPPGTQPGGGAGRLFPGRTGPLGWPLPRLVARRGGDGSALRRGRGHQFAAPRLLRLFHRWRQGARPRSRNGDAAPGRRLNPEAAAGTYPRGPRLYPQRHAAAGRTQRDKDRIKGAADQAKGAIKQGIGQATGDEKLQAEGAADKMTGKVESAVGGAKDTVRDAVNKH